MKTLTLTITAALISEPPGRIYGYDPAVKAYGDRMRGDFRSTEILNQLEEIRAQQRQIQAELFDSELLER